MPCMPCLIGNGPCPLSARAGRCAAQQNGACCMLNGREVMQGYFRAVEAMGCAFVHPPRTSLQCCRGLFLLLALHFFASTVEYTKLVWSSLSLSLLSRGWPDNPFRASRGSARFTATGSSFRKSSSLQQAPAGYMELPQA